MPYQHQPVIEPHRHTNAAAATTFGTTAVLNDYDTGSIIFDLASPENPPPPTESMPDLISVGGSHSSLMLEGGGAKPPRIPDIITVQEEMASSLEEATEIVAVNQLPPQRRSSTEPPPVVLVLPSRNLSFDFEDLKITQTVGKGDFGWVAEGMFKDNEEVIVLN